MALLSTRAPLDVAAAGTHRLLVVAVEVPLLVVAAVHLRLVAEEVGVAVAVEAVAEVVVEPRNHFLLLFDSVNLF